MRGVSLRAVLAMTAAYSTLVAVCCTTSASAASPWWHVDTLSAPASEAGVEDRLLLEVSNLGDAAVDGAAEPVTIIDQLPPGVTATQVVGEGGGSFPIGIEGIKKLMSCVTESAGRAVRCHYDGPLLSYERFLIEVTVHVESGAGDGVSEVGVTGGGAAPITWRHALELEDATRSFGAEDFEVAPEEQGGALDTQAGSHPFQLTTTLTLNTITKQVLYGSSQIPEVQPVGLAKDVRVALPPGLVGNPTPLPKCSIAVFVKEAVQCPNDTAVGVASAAVINPGYSKFVPFAETVPVYSLEPSVGEPARFGFQTQAGPVVLDASVKTGEGYGVVVTAPDIPGDLPFIDSQITFWGVPADSSHDPARGTCLDHFEGSEIMHVTKLEVPCHLEEAPQPFLVEPTYCAGALQAVAEGDSWEQPGQWTLNTPYTFSNQLGEPEPLDGCNHLSFDPSITVAPDGSQASTPSGVTVGVHVDQEGAVAPNGLAEAAVRDTTVALPAGVKLNPAGADGLSACSEAQVGLHDPGEQNCPESSKVGTLSIGTPLLPNPLEGAVYLAQQEANPFGSLIALYLVAYDKQSGVRIKLAGRVEPNLVTGQLVSTFDETPPLPFEEVQLHMFGGSRAPLATPAKCGPYATAASIAPWSGNPAASVESPSFLISSGPKGEPCPGPLPFAPSLAAGSVNLQAGAFTPLTTSFNREDGEQSLGAVQLHMPPGLSGLLTGVELCGEAQAGEGTCGPGSLIGETTVSVGVGDDPYTVKGGRVYLTGPYEGAPFGLSIVNPAKAGPFDFEATRAHHPACDCLVVRARVAVDPITAALTVTTDTSPPYNIPTILEGVPLEIRHVNVTINRPGFSFNPTNCEPMRLTGTLSSGEGASAPLSEPFQVTNCATLAFKPKFTVSTRAHTSRSRTASLHVKLQYPKAPFGSQANIHSVKVNLPKLLPSRLSTLQKACPAHMFDSNPAACPPGSRIGTATATTPLLPVRLNGPAYFVSYGSAKFPELVIVLSGYGVTVDLHGETSINEKTSVTSSTFRTVPDVPVGTFEMTLPEGPDSALAATGNLCTKKLRMPTAFAAANGRVIHQETTIAVTGCPHRKTTRHKHKR